MEKNKVNRYNPKTIHHLYRIDCDALFNDYGLSSMHLSLNECIRVYLRNLREQVSRLDKDGYIGTKWFESDINTIDDLDQYYGLCIRKVDIKTTFDASGCGDLKFTQYEKTLISRFKKQTIITERVV